MPAYEIELPTGERYQVEADRDLTEDEIIAQFTADQQGDMPAAAAAQPPPEATATPPPAAPAVTTQPELQTVGPQVERPQVPRTPEELAMQRDVATAALRGQGINIGPQQSESVLEGVEDLRPKHLVPFTRNLTSGGLNFAASLPDFVADSAILAGHYFPSVGGLEDAGWWGKENIIKPVQQLAQWIGQPAPQDARAAERFLTETLPQAAGQMLGFAVGGGLLKAVKVPATLGVAALGAMSGGAEGFQDAMAKGATMDQALASFLINAGAGTTEALTIGKWLNETAGPSLKRALIDGSEEALQEFFQSVTQTVTAQQSYDPERPWSGEEIGGATGAGFTLGSVGALIAGAVAKRRMGRYQQRLDSDPAFKKSEQARVWGATVAQDLEATVEQSRLNPRTVDQIAQERLSPEFARWYAVPEQGLIPFTTDAQDYDRLRQALAAEPAEPMEAEVPTDTAVPADRAQTPAPESEAAVPEAEAPTIATDDQEHLKLLHGALAAKAPEDLVQLVAENPSDQSHVGNIARNHLRSRNLTLADDAEYIGAVRSKIYQQLPWLELSEKRQAQLIAGGLSADELTARQQRAIEEIKQLRSIAIPQLSKLLQETTDALKSDPRRDLIGARRLTRRLVAETIAGLLQKGDQVGEHTITERILPGMRDRLSDTFVNQHGTLVEQLWGNILDGETVVLGDQSTTLGATRASTPPGTATEIPEDKRPMVPGLPRVRAARNIPQEGQSKPDWLELPEGVGQGLIFGDQTYVVGARDRKFQAVYAYVPRRRIQGSHLAEPGFPSNPNYRATNTRNYRTDPANQVKVMEGIKGFDPVRALTFGVGAGEGPGIATFSKDEQGEASGLYLQGGNGRNLIKRGLNPEQKVQYYQAMQEMAPLYGLPVLPIPTKPDEEYDLVRITPTMDLSSEAGQKQMQEAIDDMNPAAGLGEPSEQQGRNDAPKVPVGSLRYFKPFEHGVNTARSFLQSLINDGVVDRYTRTPILASDAALQEYFAAMYLGAAYGADSAMLAYQKNPKAVQTIVGLMEQFTMPIIELRARGTPEATQVADGLAEFVNRTVKFILDPKNSGKGLRDALEVVRRQQSLADPMADWVSRAVSATLEGQIETDVVTDKKTKKETEKINSDATLKAWATMTEKLGRLISKLPEGRGPDIFGGRHTELDTLREVLRAAGGDLAVAGMPAAPTAPSVSPEGAVVQRAAKPRSRREPMGDPRVKRVRKLYRERERRQLTTKEHRELERLERDLGQAFMAFLDDQMALETELEQTRAERRRQDEEEALRMIQKGPSIDITDVANTTQMGLFEKGTSYGTGNAFTDFGDDPGGPFALRETDGGFLPGIGPGDLEANVRARSPRPNERIPPYGAETEDARRQLQLAGVVHGGKGRRSPSLTARRSVVETRKSLVPPRRPWRLTFPGGLAAVRRGLASVRMWIKPGKPFAKLLDPHQVEGVERVLDNWEQGRDFGLFDGTGAGKTMQELSVAALANERYNEPVLIVTKDDRIIDNAFRKDATTLGVPIWRYRGSPPTKNQKVLIATYYDIITGKLKPGQFKHIIWDEAHLLRNDAAGTKMANVGMDMIKQADHNLFATATPLDKPEQLYYLASILGTTPERALTKVGISVLTHWRPDGTTYREYVYDDPHITEQTIQDHLEDLFEDGWRAGLVIKREVPLDNLTVHLQRVELTPEEHNQVMSVYTDALAYYTTVKQIKPFYARALALHAARAELETVKIRPTLDRVAASLKQGRQVVIYAHRINEGVFGRGAIAPLVEMLERQYGKGSVAKLYGGGSSAAERAYVQRVVDAFQQGEVKIMVATPQMGGTGLNLDDVFGDAPRDVIVMTAPFSALDTVQIAGRFSRLTTQSEARMYMLYAGGMFVDNWNMRISMRKLERLRATVRGNIEDLDPRNNPVAPQQLLREEDPILGERRRKPAKKDPLQLEIEAVVAAFRIGTRPGGAPLPRSPDGGGRRALSDQPVQMLSSRLRLSLLSARTVSIIGQEVRDMEDVAAVGQTLRNASFETLHYIMLRAGKVVRVASISTRMPNTTLFKVDDSTWPELAQAVADHQVDAIYMLHNHPSGDATPSAADTAVSGMLFRSDPKGVGASATPDEKLAYEQVTKLLQSHVVINHHKYAAINPDVFNLSGIGAQVPYNAVRGSYEWDLPGQPGPDPILAPHVKALEEVPVPGPQGSVQPTSIAPTWNSTNPIANPDQLAAFGQAMGMPQSPQLMMLVFVDSRKRIRGIGSVGVDVAVDDMVGQLREAAQAHGATSVYGYYGQRTPQLQVLQPKVDQLIKQGVMEDAWLTLDGTESARTSLEASGTRVPIKHWMGADVNEVRSRTTASLTLRDEATRTEYAAPQVWVELSPPPATAAAVNAQGYNANAPLGLKGNRIPVVLGGWQHLRQVEMPEVVKLATELMGQVPKIKKIGVAGRQGFFKGVGKGRIVIDWQMFSNPIDAAKVLLHEMGHLIDFQADTGNTLTRGNLIGRLFSLHNYLHKRYGRASVKNQQFRDELAKVTMFWRPWNSNDQSPRGKAYTEYRMSAVELYADAVSVMLNSPGLLQQMAPNFYRDWQAGLSEKSAVRNNLYAIYDLLWRGQVSVSEDRERRVQDMYRKGEDISKSAWEDRQYRARSTKGWRDELAQNWVDAFLPGLKKQGQAEKKAGPVPAELNILEVTDRFQMRDIINFRWLRTFKEQVLNGLEKYDLTVEDLGRYTLYRRIVLGDRKAFANPLGLNPKTAAFQLRMQRLQLGSNRMDILDRASRRFHEHVFKVVRSAYEAGLIYPKTWRNRILPNKDHYVAFRVLEYLTDWVDPEIWAQMGTFQEVANPVVTTVMKVMSMNVEIMRNRAKQAHVGLLTRYFPGEIKQLTKGARAAAGLGTLTVRQLGRPVRYEVDPLIAASFELPTVWKGWKGLDALFRKFSYPLIITYNLGYLWAVAPKKDFSLTARGLRAEGVTWPRARLLWQYAKVAKEAWKRFGESAGPLVREMEANFAIGTPWDTFQRLQRDDFLGQLMQRWHLTSDQAVRGKIGQLMQSKRLAWARPIMDLIERVGLTLDTMPKLAAYRLLREQGWQPKEAAFHVRHYVGLPNIHRRGRNFTAVRALMPFFNVFAQGFRDQAKLATRPKTASGYWWNWWITDGWLTTVAAAATAGWLGKELAELYAGISEYMRTNYLCIPVGITTGDKRYGLAKVFTPGGKAEIEVNRNPEWDYGFKVVFIAIPRDEGARLASGLWYKMLSALGVNADKPGGLPSQVLDFGASQVPSVNPYLTVAGAWAQYAMGVNPYSMGQGKQVVPRGTWEAGERTSWDSLRPMFKYTSEKLGIDYWLRFDKPAESVEEMVTSWTPGLGKFLRVSDYGFRERQESRDRELDAVNRQRRLAYPKEVQGLLRELGDLRHWRAAERTPEQTSRLDALRQWERTTFRPVDELVVDRLSEGNQTAAARLRQQLLNDSKEYLRNGVLRVTPPPPRPPVNGQPVR